ncbi:hypothetical protein Sjap_008323 [Stephania japonica]|uniref:Uncharacterized protein n=1 Tax=Stephania japonica TaxID=461633 RepID=A0AAP0JPQ2_9MAGN
MRFRYQIEITDQQGRSDDSRTSSTRAVSIEEFQTLMQRVAVHKRQLEEILVILRASVVVASVPSTVRVTVTQEENTPRVTTMTLLPTTTTTRLVMAVVPRASAEIAPATLTVVAILPKEILRDLCRIASGLFSPTFQKFLFIDCHKRWKYDT